VIAQRRARAEQLLSQLKNGAEFARLAASNSDGFEATRGGEMGLRPLDRYPQLFIDAVRNLKTGDITPVLQSPAGFHILRVIEQRGNTNPVTAQVQQTRARHILLRNADGLTDEEAQRRLNDYKQRIDSRAATFEDLARRFSRDGSAAQGGDLGWLYPGDTVPEFERAMDALQPGQVSAPVQSPFGWHLIEVTERRTSEVGNDRKRLIARQAVREQKLEEATEDWLRELRDGAYVEIRLDN
jgi:peptidyl-prolyl cis-trans isomerase SurA